MYHRRSFLPNPFRHYRKKGIPDRELQAICADADASVDNIIMNLTPWLRMAALPLLGIVLVRAALRRRRAARAGESI